jgi:UDP-N-acetylbacillosamine N-acetyltransferase
MKQACVIWGSGGHAVVIADAIRISGARTVAGFLDDVNPTRSGETFCGASILGGREQFDALKRGGISTMVIAIGDCDHRLQMAEAACEAGFHLVTVIHPRAVVAEGVTLGAGTVVMAGAVINPGARIGQNVIVNTGATVDHDCVLEDGVHVCPGVSLAGGVRIGRAAWVGIGSTVIQRVCIGARAFVGAGAVVLRDLPENIVAYGNPARVIRPR